MSVAITAGEALSRDAAQTSVKQYVQRRRQTVRVQEPYTEWETVKRPCNQTDVDTDPNRGDDFLARCQHIGGAMGAPHGFKKVRESRTACCRSTERSVESIRGNWVVEYSAPGDRWNVSLEFEDGAARQVLSWFVDDNSGAVSERGAP